MLRNSPFHGMLTVVSMATVGALALGQSSQGIPADGVDAALDRKADALVAVVLEGLVLRPDGASAEGAVVVSSAGGRAVTDWSGSFRLEVHVPHDATSVQVTAVGAGTSAMASSSVALDGAGRVVRVDPLALVQGSACQPYWVPTFGSLPGTNGNILALCVFDDGGGPALYAGGTLTVAGGVETSGIAKWDGSSWSAVGSGVSDTINALAVFDDGRGPALYAGGHFTTAGGSPANNIARWDGASWSALGAGLNGSGVSALATYDDGSGQALYVGGYFALAGGSPANSIAKWNGASWSALGSGVDGQVRALAVFDVGSGPVLCAGGSFFTAGGASRGIASWDGASWSALGSGVNGYVGALAVLDPGSGPALYAGGSFTLASGVPSNNIARWDGASWSALGSGADDVVLGLAVSSFEGALTLYACGSFLNAGGAGGSSYVAKWDGSSWSGFVGGDIPPQGPSALGVYDDGGGPALYVGGRFTFSSPNTGVSANGIAKWDGSSWSALGGHGMNGRVDALAVYDDGGGPALYAGGAFRAVGGVVMTDWFARWDGSSWSALADGGSVRAMVVHDDGSGPALYAAVGGVNVGRWDGASWAYLPGYMDNLIFALASFDDGSGAALYAGGYFTTAGGTPASRIARWDGSSWAPLGSGVSSSVYALASFDDGRGPALYAGGSFTTAGGTPASCIARWDGSSWAPLGSGVNETVYALASFDDRRGPALYAGGSFRTAGGRSSDRIARWNGSQWSSVGGQTVLDAGMNNTVRALAVFDDGNGLALAVGGDFTTAHDGIPVNRIAKWDGARWSALGSGVRLGGVGAVAGFRDGDGPALFVGGAFESAFDSRDSFLAKWGYGADTTPPTIFCEPVVAGDRIGSPPGQTVRFHVTAIDCQDSAPLVVCSPASGSFFPVGTTIVTCTATDASGNRSTCQFPVTVARGIRLPPR